MQLNIIPSEEISNLENYLIEIFSMDSDFKTPTIFNVLFPDIYYLKSELKMTTQVHYIMSVLKQLNILSHSLKYKNEYKGYLDFFIEKNINQAHLNTNIESISHIEAYHTIKLLIDNIHPSIIEDQLTTLNQEQKNSIAFLKIMYNELSHYVIYKSIQLK